jgi:hypothetical protein
MIRNRKKGGLFVASPSFCFFHLLPTPNLPSTHFTVPKPLIGFNYSRSDNENQIQKMPKSLGELI